MGTRLEKHRVCAECQSIGVTDLSCVCTYMASYPHIELEFEVCDCCGHPLQDGQPSDTKFNEIQFVNFKNRANGN